MIEKYIYENIANTGFKWHPVTDEHEQGGDKVYYVLDDLEDIEDFLAD